MPDWRVACEEVRQDPTRVRMGAWRDLQGDADTVAPLPASSSAAAAAAASSSPPPPPPVVPESASVSSPPRARGAAAVEDSRAAILGDLSLSFADAFERWLSKQDAEDMLSDESYAKVVAVLQKGDKTHTKHRAWSERYCLIPGRDDDRLYKKIDPVAKAAPRGPQGKRKADDVASAAAAAAAAPAVSPSHGVKFSFKMIPKASEVEAAILGAHASGVQGTGHGGILATYGRVREAWYGIPRVLVVAFVKRCANCSHREHSKSSKYEIRAVGSICFLSRMQMDLFLFTYVVEGVNVTKIVMHLQDHFTKFSLLRCLSDKSAASVAAVLLDVFTTFGAPTVLQSDNGTEFRNQRVIDLCKEFSVKQVHSAPYHPQTNGSVERANGLAKEKIAASLMENPARPWEHIVAMAQWHLNITCRRSVATTPYQLVFSRPPLSSVAPVNTLDAEASSRSTRPATRCRASQRSTARRNSA